MIVQAPDNKVIDFGDMPQDQVESAMKKLYPPSNQATGQPPANGEGPAPQNTDILNNQQDNPLFNRMRAAVAEKPEDNYFGLIPIAKSLGRGTLDMMADVSGHGQEPGSNLNKDELGALASISPVMKAGIPSIATVPTGTPLGNRMLAMAGRGVSDAEKGGLDALQEALVQPNPTTGNSLIKGITARNPEELNQASSGLKSNAGGIYTDMRKAGAILNENSASSLSQTIDNALSKNLFIPQLNPKTLGIVQHLKDEISKGAGIGLDQLDQYRRLLLRVGGSEDGVSAGMVRKAIDNSVNQLTDADLSQGGREAIDLLNKGRASYAQAAKFEELSDLVAKANGDPNKIKAFLSRFVNDDSNLIGHSPDEINAIRYAANTGMGENLLKAFGKFGFDFGKNGTGNTVLPVLASLGKVGGAALVPGGIPVVAAGTLARHGYKYIARGKAEKMLDYVQGGNK